jgi:hypothetical protein
MKTMVDWVLVSELTSSRAPSTFLLVLENGTWDLFQLKYLAWNHNCPKLKTSENEWMW